jgi:hypothetical protein
LNGRRLWNGIDRQLYHKTFKKQGKRVERAEQLVLLQLINPINRQQTRWQQEHSRQWIRRNDWLAKAV